MMGRQTVDQSQLFYLFNLERRISQRHLLRRINPIVTQILAELRTKLEHASSRLRPSPHERRPDSGAQLLWRLG